MRYVAGFECIIAESDHVVGMQPDDQPKPIEGVITDVGPGVTFYRKGDRIVWGKYSGTELRRGNLTVFVLRSNEVMARIEEE